MKILKTFEGYIEDLDRLKQKTLNIKKSVLKDIEDIIKKYGKVEFFYTDYMKDDMDAFEITDSNTFIICENPLEIEDSEIYNPDERCTIIEYIDLENQTIWNGKSNVYFEILVAGGSWEYGEGTINLDSQDSYLLVKILELLKTLTPELIEERKIKRESEKFNI